ncbi:unnamed protein product [Phytomonas sp. Hart1]|nr:unnamed protein product [Phytomonas sp. Hart1]|eukprot:CCW70912.1 unnamed protein product [Phytomonas sp. isolate Hart1]
MTATRGSLNVGVVGMGNMGIPILRNLAFKARGAFYLQIHSRSLNKARRVCDDLGVDGATCAMRLHHRYHTLTKWAEVILVVLADRGAAARVLLEDAEALLPNARAGQIIVDHTTVDVGLSRACAAAAAGRGATFLDAPMDGSPRAVFNGQLGLMVGGPAEAFQRLQPIFRMYADNINHMGEAGAGSAAKLLAQALVASHNAAAAEAMTIANRLGIEDHARLMQVLDASWGSSTMLRRNAPTMQDLVRNPDKLPPTSGATVGHLLEDLSLLDSSLSAAAGGGEEEEEEKFPVMDSALRMLGAASEAGMGDRDLSAVIHFIQAAVEIEREERRTSTLAKHLTNGAGGKAKANMEAFQPRGLTSAAFLMDNENSNTNDAKGASQNTAESPTTATTTKDGKDNEEGSIEFTYEDFY